MQRKGFKQSDVYDDMIRLAGEMWNLKASELNNIDPIVKMLFKGLASEVEKVGDELQSAETRLLKRIARQLLPTSEVSVLPAHGIIHFTPTERVEVSKYDQFLYETKWINREKFNREELLQINFSPVGSFKIFPGELKYRIEKGRVSQLNSLSKDLLEVDSYIENEREIILGFKDISKTKLSLYFDWMSSSRKGALFSALQKIRITTLSGKHLNIKPGLSSDANTSDEFELRLNPSLRLERSVLSFYKDQFLEIDLTYVDMAELQPSESTPNYLLDTLNDLEDGEDICWIRLQFPEEYVPQILQDVFIQTNCIPVVNRRMQREIFRLQPGLNIRRLQITGTFMNMERVVTSDDVKYQEDSSIKLENFKTGTYSVRHGGIGRLDERDASEFLSYLLDLMTEEKQAFYSIGASANFDDLKTIDQAIKRIQKRILDGSEKGLTPYILMKPIKDYENVYAYYWTCKGAIANGITQGSRLSSQTPGLTTSGSATLFTNTVGGRDKLNDAELIEVYRNALLTRDTIVTREDIISICAVVGGEHLTKVEIKIEVEPSSLFKEGLTKVLKIKLHLKPSGKEEIVKNYILQKLSAELENKSNFSMPYKIVAVDD